MDAAAPSQPAGRTLSSMSPHWSDRRDVPPNIMWPNDDAGFEASTFSPAGSSQLQWRAIRATRYGSTRRVRVGACIWVAMMIIPIAWGLTFEVVHALQWLW